MPLRSSYPAKVFKKGMYLRKSISSQLRESETFVRAGEETGASSA